MNKWYVFPTFMRYLPLALGLSGCSIDMDMTELLRQAEPRIIISEPTSPYLKSQSSTTYTVTYYGYKDVHLQNSDVTLLGPDTTDCQTEVTGTGNIRQVIVSGCSGDGVTDIEIAEGTASGILIENYQGEVRGSTETTITAPKARAPKALIIDNTLAELKFAKTNFEFSKDWDGHGSYY